MLKVEVLSIDSALEVHVVDVVCFDQKTIEQIEAHFVSICEGNSDHTLAEVKKYFLKFLEGKDDKKRIGAVAEFFVHLYVRSLGYKQEFLFFNLEEGSVKKGFDGYFSKGGEEYILESKAGRSNTKKISHKSKIDTAYKDICNALTGTKAGTAEKGVGNNPWRNAYRHASIAEVGTKDSIRANIKKLWRMFDNQEFASIEDLNVIPCSTILTDPSDSEDFSGQAMRAFQSNSYAAKSVAAVCVTKATYNDFIKYLGAS